jgi:hypothetical protein
MRYYIVFLTFVLTFISTAQNRASFDISYRFNALNLTLGYHKVFASNWLVSGTVNYGRKGIFFSRDLIPKNTSSEKQHITSSWSSVREVVETDAGVHYLREFITDNRALSAQIGLGYFNNISFTHGFRMHLFANYGYAMTYIKGYYTPIGNKYPRRDYQVQHGVAALSIEAYHTIRLYQKYTFYYGLKAPYYFLLNKDKYNPTYKQYHFYRFMPELSLGVTYLIGNCE